MTCTLRILIDGRERARWDGVDPTLPGLGEVLKVNVRELMRLNRKVAVTVIAGDVEHVVFSGRNG